MSKSLFSEFDPVSAKQWKQQIQVDLKGADYNEALVWESPEGIHTKPFYNSEDLNEPPLSVPGHPAEWKIVQRVFVDDLSIARHLLKEALAKGAEAVICEATKEFDIPELFDDIRLEGIVLYFEFHFL